MSKLENSDRLRRVLGFWPAFSLVLGTIIGSGIFLVTNDMIRAVGSPGMVFFIWIFGGVLSLLGALSYGELAAAMPEAGGEYVYLRAAYGPALGFLQGWANALVMFPASVAAKGAGFITFLAVFFPALNGIVLSIPLPIGPGGGPLDIQYGQLVGIGIILCLFGINYIGVRAGGRVQVFTTALKMGLIAAIIAAGIFWGKGNSSHFTSVIPASPGGVAGFFTALVAALWAYDGWNNAASIGADVERPGQNLPRVMILGTGAVIAVYLLINAAYFWVLAPEEIAGNNRVAAEMMQRVLGGSGANVVSIAAMISIFASMNGSFLAGTRPGYAMARDGVFFRPIAKLHPKFHTPGASLVLLSALSCVLLLSGRFEDLYRTVIFTSWVFYALTAISVLILRRKKPALDRPYRVHGYPLVPILFVLVAAGLLYSTLLTYPRESGIGLGMILAGLPFYFLWKRNPGPSPEN
ncbi:MAG: amino acid permease [Bryobacteraceae bacterium]